MKKLRIVISRDGDVNVQVEGVAGAACEGDTKFLENVLGGQVASRKWTADYYKLPEEQQVEEEHR